MQRNCGTEYTLWGNVEPVGWNTSCVNFQNEVFVWVSNVADTSRWGSLYKRAMFESYRPQPWARIFKSTWNKIVHEQNIGSNINGKGDNSSKRWRIRDSCPTAIREL